MSDHKHTKDPRWGEGSGDLVPYSGGGDDMNCDDDHGGGSGDDRPSGGKESDGKVSGGGSGKSTYRVVTSKPPPKSSSKSRTSGKCDTDESSGGSSTATGSSGSGSRHKSGTGSDRTDRSRRRSGRSDGGRRSGLCGHPSCGDICSIGQMGWQMKSSVRPEDVLFIPQAPPQCSCGGGGCPTCYPGMQGGGYGRFQLLDHLPEGAIPIPPSRRGDDEDYAYSERDYPPRRSFRPSYRRADVESIPTYKTVIVNLSTVAGTASENKNELEFTITKRNRVVSFQLEPFTGQIAANGVAYIAISQVVRNLPDYGITWPIIITYNSVARMAAFKVVPSEPRPLRIYFNIDSTGTGVNMNDTVSADGISVQWQTPC